MKDPQVDAYIDEAADFARPILEHLRALVHEGCPDVEESIKWSFPVFEHEGMLANMAAHKEHCSFGFWKASLVLGERAEADGMGQFGKITSLDDLPPREMLLEWVRKAAELNEKGVKLKKAVRKPAPETPPDFRAALADDPGALHAFEAMPPSHRREYVEWIVEAKREDTRKRRIAKAVDQIGDGKSLNWKYT